LCHRLLPPALDLLVSRPFLFHPGARVGEQQEVVSCVRSTEAWVQQQSCANWETARERPFKVLAECLRNAWVPRARRIPEGVDDVLVFVLITQKDMICVVDTLKLFCCISLARVLVRMPVWESAGARFSAMLCSARCARESCVEVG
jgi:hypothetical protein